MQHTPDPASYLLSEIAAYDAGLRPNWETWQRKHYFELALAEGSRIAEHLTNALGPVGVDLKD